MGRACCASRERPSRLSLRPRRPAGPRLRSSFPSFLACLPRAAARLALAALLCAGAASVAAPASADVLVSNIGQTPARATSFKNYDLAQRFTTGSHISGYTLTSIELRLGTTSATGTPTVKVFSGSANGTEVATLSGPASLDANKIQNYTFTASGTVTLSASTNYWVVAESNTDGLKWYGTRSVSEDSSSASGWSIRNGDELRDATSTGNFTFTPLVGSRGGVLMIRVNGTANPLPIPPRVAGTSCGSEARPIYAFWWACMRVGVKVETQVLGSRTVKGYILGEGVGGLLSDRSVLIGTETVHVTRVVHANLVDGSTNLTISFASTDDALVGKIATAGWVLSIGGDSYRFDKATHIKSSTETRYIWPLGSVNWTDGQNITVSLRSNDIKVRSAEVSGDSLVITFEKNGCRSRIGIRNTS